MLVLNCRRCKADRKFFLFDKDYNAPKIRLGVILLNDGLGSVTFRQIANTFSIRRRVISAKCSECNDVVILCPYCKGDVTKNVKKDLIEICPHCRKKYYMYL